MGQFLLGLRSLFLRLAIFVLFAAILVWFLGGNLTAEPVIVRHGSVPCATGYARVVQVIPPLESLPSEREIWQVEVSPNGEDDWRTMPSERILVRATDLTRAPDGMLYFAGASSGLKEWTIFALDCATGALSVRSSGYAASLEVERQLARLGRGLPVQSAEVSAQAQDAVLRAGD